MEKLQFVKEDTDYTLGELVDLLGKEPNIIFPYLNLKTKGLPRFLDFSQHTGEIASINKKTTIYFEFLLDDEDEYTEIEDIRLTVLEIEIKD